MTIEPVCRIPPPCWRIRAIWETGWARRERVRVVLWGGKMGDSRRGRMRRLAAER
jgi:hypothetical protein